MKAILESLTFTIHMKEKKLTPDLVDALFSKVHAPLQSLHAHQLTKLKELFLRVFIYVKVAQLHITVAASF